MIISLIFLSTACEDGTYGAACAQNCSCIDENTKSCSKVDGFCECLPGWTGADCGEDINECNNITDPCIGTSDTQCLNTNGSYKCVCEIGFVKAGASCHGKSLIVCFFLNHLLLG